MAERSQPSTRPCLISQLDHERQLSPGPHSTGGGGGAGRDAQGESSLSGFCRARDADGANGAHTASSVETLGRLFLDVGWTARRERGHAIPDRLPPTAARSGCPSPVCATPLRNPAGLSSWHRPGKKEDAPSLPRTCSPPTPGMPPPLPSSYTSSPPAPALPPHTCYALRLCFSSPHQHGQSSAC